MNVFHEEMQRYANGSDKAIDSSIADRIIAKVKAVEEEHLSDTNVQKF
jgi:hypothetical protein